jgi:acyl-CoA synthetase (AMP-forming)/AMP-acid ligase II
VFGRDVASLVSGRGMHLGALTRVLADRYGTRPAVDDPGVTPGFGSGGRRSFADLEEVVARTAAVLADRGVGAGRRVLILVGNRVDIATLIFAVARLGAVAVPLNHRLTRPEVRAVSAATRADLAIVDDRLSPLVPDDMSVLTTEVIGQGAQAASDAWMEPGAALDPDATAILLTTSGTTGVPKAAALTSRGLLGSLGRLAAAPVGIQRGPRGGRDLVLASLPLTHVMGLSTLLGALAAGVPTIRRERFDAGETLDLIEERRPNVVVGVPTMYADLEHAGAAERDLSSVQLWVSAADAMPTDRARRFQRHGALIRVLGMAVGSAVFLDVFGMVELSGPAAVRVYPPSPVGAVHAPSFAVALPGIDVRAVGDDGHPLAPGRVGTLQWRGAGVLRGYEGADGDAGLADDGWFAGGDRGRVWPGGLVRLAGRDRDRLKVAGFSVFPAEVEEELRAAPTVRDLAVVGLPDERTGDRLVAIVVPGAGFDPEAFLAWAHDEVAGYRRPTAVITVEQLPRGNHGKLDRDAATELASAAGA